MRRILHWELVVRELERSISFYEALTPARATAVVDSPGGRSALLLDAGASTPHLRLVEPRRPVGLAHDSIGAIGFTRVVLHVADLAGTRARAESLGLRPIAPTTGDDFAFDLGSRGRVGYRVWCCLDPDGIVVEFLEDPVPKVSTVAQGTASLPTAVAFARDELGLAVVDTVATPGPVPNVYLPGGAPVEFRGAFLRVPGEERGYLDILEHTDPAVRRRAYDDDAHIGVIRCALEVDDLGAARDAYVVDFGGPLGRRRVVDLLDPEGVRYRLVAPAEPALTR